MRFVGHHPTCENFSAHILQFGSKIYCAGCTGLVLGAIISLLGILLYSFHDYNFGGNAALIFWVGFISVVCGLLQYHIPNGNSGLVHFFLNVTFVLGAFLLLVGVNNITSNFILEVYLLALTTYWIIARIIFSQIEHRKICATCLQSCSYF
jgi:membrane-bound ClpP family serine protease